MHLVIRPSIALLCVAVLTLLNLLAHLIASRMVNSQQVGIHFPLKKIGFWNWKLSVKRLRQGQELTNPDRTWRGSTLEITSSSRLPGEEGGKGSREGLNSPWPNQQPSKEKSTNTPVLIWLYQPFNPLTARPNRAVISPGQQTHARNVVATTPAFLSFPPV
jgi:hypothetical protein